MADPASYHLCVAWPQFRSLQLDYLDAVQDRIAREGAALIGLETAYNDSAHEVHTHQRARAHYQHEALFKVRAYSAIPAASMHRKAIQTLDRLQPDAVVMDRFNVPDSRACLLWCKQNHRPGHSVDERQRDTPPPSPGRAWIRKRLLSLFDAAIVANSPQKAYLELAGLPASCVHLGHPAVDQVIHQEGRKASSAALENAADILWNAVQSGNNRSQRPRPFSKTILRTIQQLARTVHSFQPTPY